MKKIPELLKKMTLKPMRAKISCPNEFREPAAEIQFSEMVVDVLGPDDPKTLDEMRAAYGQCLMRCRTDGGEEFVAFETELEPIQ